MTFNVLNIKFIYIASVHATSLLLLNLHKPLLSFEKSFVKPNQKLSGFHNDCTFSLSFLLHFFLIQFGPKFYLHILKLSLFFQMILKLCFQILIYHYNIVLFKILLSSKYTLFLCMLASLTKRNIYMLPQCSNNKLVMNPLFKILKIAQWLLHSIRHRVVLSRPNLYIWKHKGNTKLQVIRTEDRKYIKCV